MIVLFIANRKNQTVTVERIKQQTPIMKKKLIVEREKTHRFEYSTLKRIIL